jgi:hypothetical protein
VKLPKKKQNKKSGRSSKANAKGVTYQIEKVFWEDHYSGNTAWTTKLSRTTPLTVASVGMKVHEDKKVLVLAQNMGENLMFADTVHIIKKCITSRKKLGTIYYDQA